MGLTLHNAGRPAGPFLISIGATLLIALAFGHPPSMPASLTIFLIGMVLSFTVLFGGMIVMGVPRPTGIQRAAIVGSIGLEWALFALRPHLTGPLTPAGNWIAALMVVGIHFIPFAIALGLEIAILGLCCTVNAVLAITGWSSPAVWISIDALLKIGFGIWICLRQRGPLGAATWRRAMPDLRDCSRARPVSLPTARRRS